MARSREIHATDYMSGEYADALDFVTVANGVPSIEPISEREFTDRVEFEKFMQDVLVIEVHQTANPNDPPSAFVGSNGAKGWIPRGRPVKIRREFVASLIQSQPADFRTVKNPDADADEGMMVRRTTSMAYPFTVKLDPSPKGRAWLERMMKQA